MKYGGLGTKRYASSYGMHVVLTKKEVLLSLKAENVLNKDNAFLQILC